jgi:hypothetical protein
MAVRPVSGCRPSKYSIHRRRAGGCEHPHMTTKHHKARARHQNQRASRSRQSGAPSSIEAVVLEDFLMGSLELEGMESEEIERVFDESMAATSLTDAFGGFLAAAETVLPSLESPLDAEMWGSELLGMLRLMGLDPQGADELVAKMVVPMAETTATPAALAFLVVLSSLGRKEVAHTAKAARQKLVAASVPEPAWAARLGTPAVGRCWVYRDVFGEQESIFATFRYGRSEHVVSVLVDHVLGGGVKDSYVSTQAKKLYRQMTELTSDDPVTFIDDLDITEAASKLEKALTAPPCPVAADQIRDSMLTDALVRSRVAHLSASAASPPHSASGGRGARLTVAPSNSAPRAPAGVADIWQVKVTLNGTRPPIWRRLEVAGDVTLGTLHRVIQDAFGWWDSHLHVFETHVGSFGVPDRELGFADEGSVALREVAPRTGDRLKYTYDFGDSWEHVIVVEKLVTGVPGTHYPRCTGGRKACPPEDCGGVWGYQELLHAVRDPEHEDHDEMASWLEETIAPGFDPAKFEISEANARLARAG